MKNTTENNKLIAEFMGEININKYIGLWYLDNMQELNYNEDWNKLMPVVEKIEDLPEYRTGKAENVRLDLKMALNYNHKELSKIESVHQMIVQFIKWYNKNTAKKKTNKR